MYNVKPVLQSLFNTRLRTVNISLLLNTRNENKFPPAPATSKTEWFDTYGKESCWLIQEEVSLWKLPLWNFKESYYHTQEKKSNLHTISIQIEKFNSKTVLPKERLSRNVRPAKKLSMLTRCHISAWWYIERVCIWAWA